MSLTRENMNVQVVEDLYFTCRLLDKLPLASDRSKPLRIPQIHITLRLLEEGSGDEGGRGIKVYKK